MELISLPVPPSGSKEIQWAQPWQLPSLQGMPLCHCRAEPEWSSAPALEQAVNLLYLKPASQSHQPLLKSEVPAVTTSV